MRFVPVAIATVLLFISFAFTGSQAAAIKGVVFEDKNRNGVRDDGEKGIAGVLVSNQLDVVKTDRRGGYQLKLSDGGGVIFVIKPAGYALPLDSNNLPRFYYVHRPDGSPRSYFAGVPPTGPLPESIDFPLIRTAVKNSFEVLIFADPQVAMEDEIDFVRDDVVAGLLGTGIDFGITLGDIVYNDLSLYERYNSVVGHIGIPFYNLPGNHDMNFDSAGDEFSLETYLRFFGPPYYAVEKGQVSFIMLDTIEWLGREANSTGNYRGGLGERQLRWLEGYLEHQPEDRLIALAMHIPLCCPRSPDEHLNVSDRGELFRLFEDRRHLLGIVGHMHGFEHVDLAPEHGWRGRAPFPQVICSAVSGAWWHGPKDERGIPSTDQQDGAPNGYHVFHFEGNEWWQEYRAAGFGSDYQLRISTPAGIISAGEADTARVVVNVFNGTGQWTVEASVDRGGFSRLSRVLRPDPYFQQLRREYAALYADWIRPALSPHMWEMPLPAGLTAGVHSIKVRAVDGQGRTFTGGRVFEIE